MERYKNILAVILVLALAYVVYTQILGIPLLPGIVAPEPPAEPDISRLEDLGNIASVRQEPVLSGRSNYDLSGRNLFQFGRPKPPPPTPEELEARRRAEEERLKAMEEEARKRAEQQRRLKEEQERRSREAMNALEQQRQSETDAQPARSARKPPPPPINLKLVGYLGRQSSRIAVFIRGEEIVLGKVGEVIEGKFKVLSMGPESVMMGYVDPQHESATKQIDMGS
jgi:hypothetical protein